jgi:hypothetical protein
VSTPTIETFSPLDADGAIAERLICAGGALR